MNLNKPFRFACRCVAVLVASHAVAAATPNTGNLSRLLTQLKQHPNLPAAGQSLYNLHLESSFEKEGGANHFTTFTRPLTDGAAL